MEDRYLKIVGYIAVGELEDNFDPDHSSGLTEEGFMNLIVGETGKSLKLSDLEDVETSVVTR